MRRFVGNNHFYTHRIISFVKSVVSCLIPTLILLNLFLVAIRTLKLKEHYWNQGRGKYICRRGAKKIAALEVFQNRIYNANISARKKNR